MAAVDAEEAKARAMTPTHTIIKIPDKNKALFTQIIVENLHYLYERNYLSIAEKAFLMELVVYVEINSNALALSERSSACPKMSELSKALKRSRTTTSTLINRLIRKGLLYEVVDTDTLRQFGRPMEERPIFFNPELIFAGDKNRINLTLCRIHWVNDRLEKNGLKLPWKIWYAQNGEYGRLYRRKTWLKKRGC